MDDIIFKENFFSKELMERLNHDLESLSSGSNFVDPAGIWVGQLIANQRRLVRNEVFDTSVKEVIDLILPEFDLGAFIAELSYVKLYLPWDIHTDSNRQQSFTQRPYYNVLIPLHSVDSRTIIFNEASEEFNEFSKFKEQNQKSNNPVSLDIWNKYLDMCWDHDREWLSIKEILPAQDAGQFIAFKRKFFHSSDNFHKRLSGPKRFLQIIVDQA